MQKEGLKDKVGETDAHRWVKDIRKDDRIKGLYLVKAKKRLATKKGDPYLSVTLADRTGDIEAKVWDRVEDFDALFKEGDVLEFDALAGCYMDQVQLTISGMRVPADPVDPCFFLETCERDGAEMVAALRNVLKKIANPHLKNLCDRFLSDHAFMTLFKKAPAAKNFHHGYLGGLLEHTLSVCEMVLPISSHYPELDKDLLMAGAFLHDVGKVKELSFERKIDYTDEGRLLGHIVLGVAMVDEKLGAMKSFPSELALRLKHLILSHHGEYEFGSPKRPKCLEAFALHLIDDLDAKMNGLDRFMKRDRQDGNWTDFNRLFGRYFLKAVPENPEENMQEPVLNEIQRGLFSK
ncbi:MAG: HD domain-containing protein [Desulfobacteraceae bacterium]|nr:MAG: HD domain-containing protein [Desulfobacteraceae bacterium]